MSDDMCDACGLQTVLLDDGPRCLNDFSTEDIAALVAEVQRHRAVMANLDALPEQMAEAWGGDASWFTTGTKVAALVADWLADARTEAT